MANHLPKGRERIRKLGRLGGVSSGEARRQLAFNLKMTNLFCIWYTGQKAGCTDEQIAASLEPLDVRGGGHDEDWRRNVTTSRAAKGACVRNAVT
ncbi:MAG: hypothetical protein WBQ46_13290 [Terriglobales bacterium]